MGDHQMTLLQIKNDLLDLWTDETALQSYDQWFEALKPKLSLHFGIVEADFLIFSEDCFMPLQGHRSVSKRKDAIQYSTFKSAVSSNSFLTTLHARGFDYADDFLLFSNRKSEPLGLLVLKSTCRWKDFRKSSFFPELGETVSRLIQLVGKMVYLVTGREKFQTIIRRDGIVQFNDGKRCYFGRNH